MITTEPFAGYTVRGPYSDGTFAAFAREATGDHVEIGRADDYESAREIALADSTLRQDAWA